MCGITGFANWQNDLSSEALRAVGLAMGNALRHRGPDSSDTWCDPNIAVTLSHRRLAIVDLSPAGHQPMMSHDDRYIISFNGEIYNHLDIRAELDSIGMAPAWRGHSDTETLLAAIVAWQLEGALSRLVGMFAFGLWDRKEQILSLSRDRLGEKPLYYGWLGSTFVFGSELKALRQHPQWNGEIDRDALVLMMRHGYVPAPFSIFAGIRKLPPGEYLILSQGAQQARVERYWSLGGAIADGRRSRFAGDASDAVERLDYLLRKAVRQQMISDVPLGAFLSGGIDSSAVVALMQAESRKPIRTFSIGFNEKKYNEADHAQAVARHLKTDHTELYVTAEQAIDVIPRLPEIYDEPFADPSQIPTFLVAELARRSVTVALSGDGGDELFSGYDRYRIGAKIFAAIERLPRAGRSVVATVFRTFPPDFWLAATRLPLLMLPPYLRPDNPGQKVHRLADMLAANDVPGMYSAMISQWQAPQTLVRESREPRLDYADLLSSLEKEDAVDGMMAIDSSRYLPDDILVKVDRAAMAVSLETRVPLLDHRVVEFAWSLPQETKVRDGKSKWPLRQLLDRYVPSHLTDRPKMGFGVPIDSWLRGPLRSWAEELLDEKRLNDEGFFDVRQVRTRWRQHLDGLHDWQYPLWNVLMFQSWYQNINRAF